MPARLPTGRNPHGDMYTYPARRETGPPGETIHSPLPPEVRSPISYFTRTRKLVSFNFHFWRGEAEQDAVDESTQKNPSQTGGQPSSVAVLFGPANRAGAGVVDTRDVNKKKLSLRSNAKTTTGTSTRRPRTVALPSPRTQTEARGLAINVTRVRV
jgi:hypothetical protein